MPLSHEGKVWRVDFTVRGDVGSVVVLANTLSEAQEMARKALPDVEVVGFYAIAGMRGAIYK